MQLKDKIDHRLSVDTGSSPQDLLLKKYEELTDTTLLLEAVQVDQPFPVATTVVSMGTIAQGKWIYVKPTADCSLIFNGGLEQRQFRAGKASRLWMNFTAVSVVVTGAINQIHIVIAGE